MPRVTVQDRPDAVAPRAALIASAAQIKGAGVTFYRKPEPWQEQCWHYRDTLGEVRYAASWFANALSRATIYPAKYDAKGVLQPVKTGPLLDDLTALMGGLGGTTSSLKAIGEHLFVVGEFYLLGRAPRTDEERDIAGIDVYWEVLGSDEVKKRGEKWFIDYGEGERYEVKKADDLFRVHTPHPRSRRRADSPLRAVLGSLREIEILSQNIASQATSKLVQGGVLFISQEMTFTSPVPNGDGEQVPSGVDPFMLALGRAMAAAIADPSSPEAHMPIVARVPGDQVDAQNHMTFWSPFDEKTIDYRSDAIRRTALGIDLPPEVLLGTADVNHWGAWQIEESTIKAHIEPALEVVAAAFTRILRTVSGDEEVVCVFDTSALRLRPNRTKEAFELWDRGEINNEALRRETGFSEADNPTDDERKDWYLRKIASGSASPEMVAEALRLLTGVEMPVADNTMRETPPDPSLVEQPVPGPPEMSQQEIDARRAALEATCDAVIMRALERAGNRLRNNTSSRPEGVDPAEMHLYVQPRVAALDSLLDGAWSTLPRLLRNQSCSHEAVQRALDAYSRSILSNQQQHDPDTMMRFVDAALTR